MDAKPGPEEDVQTHCASYICAFNTLVHNPKSVEHFFDVLQNVAIGADVTIAQVRDMARDDQDPPNEVGCMVHIDVYVPL